MSIELKDSETKGNLMRAFAGESQARNRYTFSGKQARKQGYYVIEQIFNFTADQEYSHAKLFYEHLRPFIGETITVDGSYPVDLHEDLEQLLRAAAHNEFEEHDDVYKKFGEKAKEEGFPQIAAQFRMIGSVEKIHGDRFTMIADMIRDNKLFVSDVETEWMCLYCGYVHEGKEAPEVCPNCRHGQGFFVRITLAPYTKACDEK